MTNDDVALVGISVVVVVVVVVVVFAVFVALVVVGVVDRDVWDVFFPLEEDVVVAAIVVPFVTTVAFVFAFDLFLGVVVR
jgi:hypothetical protein